MLLQIFGLDQKGWILLMSLTFSSCLASLLLRWKTADTVFVVLNSNFQVWMYSSMVSMSLFNTPFTACQPPSACVNAILSAYAYFLEAMVGKSEV